ncbi:MAG: BMP family ABC transporter substrate-binding protein [Muribaculaceae bacterium]|nr:BMP family ABC transporter substrate-binding protein [Muribaculaceae bacterium]
MLCCLLAAVGFAACSSDEPADPSKEHGEVTPQVIFLFSPGGLGDMSYNDCILEGVQKFKKAHPEIDIFLYSPQNLGEAERIFTDWLKRPGSDIPVVFTFASADYEDIIDRHIDDYELTDNKRILMFESLKRYADERIRTFQVSMFGASYLCGALAARIDGGSSLVLMASSSDIPTASAKDGFIAGYGRECDVEYLADDWSGYVMADVTYRRMSGWAANYGFIFPVAGGSNAGLYRYSREYDACPFLAGMDVDQSGLSKKITGSVVKRFDLLIDEYFNSWLQTGNMPESQTYGLESGYVEFMLAPGFSDEFSDFIRANKAAAVEKEKEYEALN